jgi:hypothetical protein
VAAPTRRCVRKVSAEAGRPVRAQWSALCAGEGEERGDGLLAAVVTQRQPAEGQQPGHAAFDDPAVPAQPLGGFDAAAGDAGGDPAAGQVAADPAVVVALVGVQLGGRRRGRPRPAPFTPTIRFMTGATNSESCRFAAETTAASGRPAASTSRWYFGPFFPRSVGFGPVSAPPFWPAR